MILAKAELKTKTFTLSQIKKKDSWLFSTPKISDR